MNEVIAVDIGNSRISCGLFRQGELVEIWHEQTNKPLLAVKNIASMADRYTAVAISSVVPDTANIISSHLLKSGIGCQTITAAQQRLLSNTYKGMGVDRIANAVAAWKLYTKDRAAAVIDFGTATTLTTVDTSGQFKGGFITLGLGSILTSLHERAAQLPNLKLDYEGIASIELGQETQSAMLSGTMAAHIGLAESWLAIARRDLGSELTAIATGGWSKAITRHTEIFEYQDSNLTLKGIHLMALAAKVPVDLD